MLYIESENYKGYDPYDILNAKLSFSLLGKWGPALATQVHKRNPINLRPLLGIKKGFNPKGMGLLLKAYCILFQISGEKEYKQKADFIFKWLIDNYTKGYSGYCWGSNFPWASSSDYKEAYLPSVVVTSAVIDGIYEYYKITKSDKAKSAIGSASEYILKDIPVTRWADGLSFAYTHQAKGACYNASLLAAEVLARAKDLGYAIEDEMITEAVNYVLNRQKDDGVWYYSYNPDKNTERKQIDFHQGFVLVSLYNIKKIIGLSDEKINEAIKKGADYYWNHQFDENGRSYWRLPKKYPVDIHNQSQGVITFSVLSGLDNEYLKYAEKILSWTIDNMQDKTGYFYYRKHPLFTDKTPYMRWGQAWMLLAFAEYLKISRVEI